jgi:two-component system cell cycle response regulator
MDGLAVDLNPARNILAAGGYHVIAAGSVAEGLARVRESACHLILSDACMSEANGYEFLLALRADPPLQALPFVLMTSTPQMDNDRVHGLALGANRFLSPPIEPEVFLAEIRTCLDEKGTN